MDRYLDLDLEYCSMYWLAFTNDPTIDDNRNKLFDRYGSRRDHW